MASRDQADANWITIGYFDESAKTWTPHINPAAVYAADTGSANAYAVAPAPAWASYATGGPIVCFVAANANSGAATLAVSGLTAKNIVRRDGSPLVAGDIPGTNLTVCAWNQAAGNFTLLTQRETPPTFVKGLFSKLKITSAGSVQTATITADSAVLLDTNGNPYLATAVNLTPSLASSGAGGLDTGSVTASTWYAVHLIYNGSTLQALFSLSDTAPTMPGGYTFRAFAGWVQTDTSGTPKVVAFNQWGRKARRTNTGSGLPALATGSSGNVATPTWTAIAVAAFVPPGAVALEALVETVFGFTGLAPSNSYGAYNSTTNPPPVMMGNTNFTTVQATIYLEGSSVYYFANSANSAAFAAGWELNL